MRHSLPGPVGLSADAHNSLRSFVDDVGLSGCDFPMHSAGFLRPSGHSDWLCENAVKFPFLVVLWQLVVLWLISHPASPVNVRMFHGLL